MEASLQGSPNAVTRRTRILLVDDEHQAPDMLTITLQSAGYSPHLVRTGQEALRNLPFARPDLILLGLRLPDGDGPEILRCLREWTTSPILVMSVRHEESEMIACLDAGADDYLTKPFTMGELLARLRAALRRSLGVPQSELFTAGNLTLDFTKREVFIGDEPVKLTATEYDLLRVLATHAGLVRTHHQLIHEVWGSTQYQDAVHLLRVTVSNLRRKLVYNSEAFQPLVTELGVGYRLRSNSRSLQLSGGA